MTPLPGTNRWLRSPQPIVVGALGLAALGVGAAIRVLRPSARSGRTERFEERIREALEEAALRRPGYVVRADAERGRESAGRVGSGRVSVESWRSEWTSDLGAGADAGAAVVRPGLLLEQVNVDVHEGFGKPTLVSTDIVCSSRIDEGVGADAGVREHVDVRKRMGAAGDVDSDALAVPDVTAAAAPMPVPAAEAAPGAGESSRMMEDTREVLDEVSARWEEEAAAMLSVVVDTIWNLEIAPVAIRGRILMREGVLRGSEDARGDVGDTEGAASSEKTLRVPEIPERDEGNSGASTGTGAEGRVAEEESVASLRLVADMTALGYAGETARPDDLYERLGAPAADPTWRP